MRNDMLRVRAPLLFFASESRGMGLFSERKKKRAQLVLGPVMRLQR